MLRNKLYIGVLLISSIFVLNCGGSGGDDGGGGDKILPPEASSLVSPANNEECNQGNVVSATESNVRFEWSKAANANSYTVVLKNLDTNSTEEFNSTTNITSIKLLRGVPYSWQVVSKSNKTTTTASSETWRFYNAGEGVSNYAPFPANLVSPAMGSTTTATVSLEWTGSDIDNDIEDYKVYLSTSTPPTDLQATTTDTSVSNITLTADSVYYWRVVTTDSQGNNSQSPIFEFRTE